MKVSEIAVVHGLVKTNGQAIVADQDAVLVGVDSLTDEQEDLFDSLMTMFLKEHGLSN